MTAAVLAAVSTVAALLLLPPRAARARARLGRVGVHLRGSGGAATDPPLVVADGPDGAADLAERLAGVALAGLPPERAWALLAARGGPHAAIAAAVSPWLAAGVPAGRALQAVVLGPDVPAPARAHLTCVAVALDACERAGAPVAPALASLAAALRAEHEAERDREAALAAPRSTAAVMTALPGIGLLLGLALGVDPLAVLVDTVAGRVALVLGLSCWAAGRWWIHRLVALATP